MLINQFTHHKEFRPSDFLSFPGNTRREIAMVRTPCSALSKIPMEVCTKTEITGVPNLRTTVFIGSGIL